MREFPDEICQVGINKWVILLAILRHALIASCKNCTNQVLLSRAEIDFEVNGFFRLV